MTTVATHTRETPRAAPTGRTIGLSGRLALATIALVLLAQVVVFVPALATFRRGWLNDRVVGARMMALALSSYPESETLPDGLESGMKAAISAPVIALRGSGTRWLQVHGPLPNEIGTVFDLRNDSWWSPLRGLFMSLIFDNDRPGLVFGRGVQGIPAIEHVEMIFDSRQLHAAMATFARNFLVVSLIVSGLTAGLMFLVLHRFMVRPVHRLTTNITAFAEAPEGGAVIRPSGRTDEIGLAELALARMQSSLSGELRHRSRLAELGLAVSKINHELRNMLTTAQLLGDRLGEIDDPSVQRIAPRLIRTLNRAITFCGATLAFGRAPESPPRPGPVALRALVDELTDLTRLAPQAGIVLDIDVPPDLRVQADAEHLGRALSNLVRNAVQALGHARTPDARIRISAGVEDGVAAIRITDNGPGLPARVRADMFAPFQPSRGQDGAGLGLHIAHELARLQGGTLALEPVETGTRLVLRLPLPPGRDASRPAKSPP